MRWRQRTYAARPRRPKVRRLIADEQRQVLAEIANAVQQSPVLRAFCVEARVLRGRFYLYWRWRPDDEACAEVWGRITPLEEPKDEFMLELDHHKGRWSLAGQGSICWLMNAVAGDRRGTFHGLGALDASLRKVAQE